MSFNVLFMAHSPDADWQRHQSCIDTGQFVLWTIVVQDQAQALEIAKVIDDQNRLDSILLCPGFSHADVAEIFHFLKGREGVSVARGDGISNQIAAQARKKAYER